MNSKVREYREYGRGLTISKSELDKGTYGYFHRNGKTFIRNYNRMLSNGRGITLLAILADKTIKALNDSKFNAQFAQRIFDND